MSGQAIPFTHWSQRRVDASLAGRESDALIRRLTRTGRLGEYRACWFPAGSRPGIRQALFIDLGVPAGAGDGLGRLRSLWLVEDLRRKLLLLGNERQAATAAVAGTVLRDLPVLDPASAWWRRVASTSAARVMQPMTTAGSRPWTARDQDLLAAVELDLLCQALTRFSQGLDGDLLAALNAEGAHGWETYNYYWNPDGTPNRNRLQAAQQFPFFISSIRADWLLRRGVERGAPLLRELTHRYQVHPRIIQQVRHLNSTLVPPEQRMPLLKRLDQLPAEYLPKSDKDWTAFLELSAPLEDLARLLGVELPRLARPFAQGWHVGRDLLSEKLGTDFDTAAIQEWMQATYRYGVVPRLASELTRGTVNPHPPAAFFSLWFGHYGLARLAEMAARWQRLYRQFILERLGVQDPGVDAQLGWQGLLGTSAGQFQGPYRILELTSRQALELEGREQQHCVASYAVKCLLGDSAIFSIRLRESGKTLSTFEVGLTLNKPTLIRHHGACNEKPPADLQAVAENFIHHWLVPVPAEDIATLRAGRREVGAAIRGWLPKPDTPEIPLSDQERALLAEQVAFGHPAEVQRAGVLGFLGHQGHLAAFVH